jgi:hypothetical protein
VTLKTRFTAPTRRHLLLSHTLQPRLSRLSSNLLLGHLRAATMRMISIPGLARWRADNHALSCFVGGQPRAAHLAAPHDLHPALPVAHPCSRPSPESTHRQDPRRIIVAGDLIVAGSLSILNECYHTSEPLPRTSNCRWDTAKTRFGANTRRCALHSQPPRSEESPRAPRQRVPPVKVRSPRLWGHEDGFGQRFPAPRVRP